MSGLSAKIVSSWLTETDERSLQVAFCHKLINDGHRIVHSTSHNAMELGKDIISLDKNGKIFVYQLKSHSGSHITMSDFRSDIQGQLPDLCQSAVLFPGLPRRLPDGAFIVANSDFHEHVHHEVNGFNAAGVIGRAPLSLIGRSQILADVIHLADALIPDDIASSRDFLEILMSKGDGEFPIEKFAPILEKIVDGYKGKSNQEVLRVVTRLSLTTEVIAAPWRRVNNHWGIFQAYGCCLMAINLMAAKLNKVKNLLKPMDFIAEICADCLRFITHEVANATSLGTVIGSHEYDKVGQAKFTHLMGIAGISATVDSANKHIQALQTRESASKIINKFKKNRYLWGEAAVPHGLGICIYLERYENGVDSAKFWDWLIRAVLDLNSGNNRKHFPPWKRLDKDVAKTLLGLAKFEGRAAIQSFWCDPMIKIGIRLNYKLLIKSLWPLAVEIGSQKFTPTKKADIFRYRCEKGINESIRRPQPTHWSDLVVEIKQCSVENEIYKVRPYWYLLTLLIYPHRIDTNLLIALFPEYSNGCWH